MAQVSVTGIPDRFSLFLADGTAHTLVLLNCCFKIVASMKVL